MRVKTGLVWSLEQKLAFDKTCLDDETDRVQRKNIVDEVAKKARDLGSGRLAQVANVEYALQAHRENEDKGARKSIAVFKSIAAPAPGQVGRQHKEFDRDAHLKKELEAQKTVSETLMAE